MTYSVLHIDDAERIAGHGFAWRPLRKALGTTAFGVNAYTADAAGDDVIETHDELSAGRGRPRGALRRRLRARPRSPSTATRSRRRPGTTARRPARDQARRDRRPSTDTTVLVIGGVPGAAGPRSPFEYWYAAEPHYRSGDYARAVEIASEGLADWPEHPSLHYQLACYEALRGPPRAGDRAPEDRVREQPGHAPNGRADDEDLASVRDDPALA